jgi:hypothetical protein
MRWSLIRYHELSRNDRRKPFSPTQSRVVTASLVNAGGNLTLAAQGRLEILLVWTWSRRIQKPVSRQKLFQFIKTE